MHPRDRHDAIKVAAGLCAGPKDSLLHSFALAESAVPIYNL